MKKYVVLAGNIGAGKTTLVRMMCERLGWKPYFEPVVENPYLEDFYRDMGRWAFSSQVFFLTHRVRSHRALMDDPWSVVQDRCLYEDAEVFAAHLAERGLFPPREYETYLTLYRTIHDVLPPPKLLIYLKSSVRTQRRRIALRGRPMECGLDPAYLRGLNRLYREWIGRWRASPVLVLDADRLDFVADLAHQADTLTTLRRHLA